MRSERQSEEQQACEHPENLINILTITNKMPRGPFIGDGRRGGLKTTMARESVLFEDFTIASHAI